MMLTIRAIGSSKEQVSYYATLGEKEQHDYYSEDDNRPGTWWGGGAKKLSLSGTVEQEVFAHLLKGYSQDGEKRLVQNAGEERRRAAFDLTFSVPKSVSAAWSQADTKTRQLIERCLEESLHEVLRYLEKECGATRRGKAGAVVEKTGLVAAIFRHDTSRPVEGELPDANLHFHVVVANLCVREDGSTGSFDARPLFRTNMMMALGALYRAEVSKALGEQGLLSHRPKKPGQDVEQSWFELDVTPESLIEAMSKRRGDIKRYLAEHGLNGGDAKEAEKAALRTRGKKTSHTRAELDAAWKELGREHGFTNDVLQAVLRERSHGRVSGEVAAKKVLEASVARLMSDKSHFTEIDLMRHAAESAQTRGIGAADVVRAVKEALSNDRQFVRLCDNRGVPRYTTHEMLSVERKLLKTASTLHSRSAHAISFAEIREVEKAYPTLREEQRQALRHVTTGSDIACVNGVAGSGKTFLLQAARAAFERAGYGVLGTALSAKAACGLEEGSGIASMHIHKLLYEIQKERVVIGAKTVLVVDEAGMVGTRQMETLAGLVEKAQAKLVLVGDHRQLQAISSGAPFRVLSERVGVCELNEIIRQASPRDREIVYQMRDGNASQALSTLYSQGRLHIEDSREDAMKRLVGEWWESRKAAASPDKVLVFAGTNLEVRILSAMCQAVRQSEGELSNESVRVNGESLHVGDRIIATRNNPSLSIQNGMLGTVTEIAPGSVRVRFDGGYHVEVDVRQYDALALSYALSTHKGQGATSEKSLVLVGGSIQDRELSYVQCSRAKHGTQLFCDKETAGEDFSRLSVEMSRSRQKDMAHEYLLEEVA